VDEMRDGGGERQVVLAANRAPVEVDDGGRMSLAPGGLATALVGVGQRRGARWVACARTPAERLLAAGPTSVRASLLPDGQPIEVSFADVDPVAYALHYRVAANPVLWLVQHEMVTGQTYHFCSVRCQKAFEADPGAYAGDT
jgi:trehalose-6-phosphate synthase